VELSQAIIIFIFETLFLITVLCVCLKFAAIRHKDHLKKIIQQINKTNPDNSDPQEKVSNSELRDRLMAKIRKLQNQVRALEVIEKKYRELLDKSSGQDVQLGNKTGDGNGFAIKVGTTVDRESGVDQNYLDYLSRKGAIQDSQDSTNRIDHQSRAMNSKLEQQKTLIQSLEGQIKEYKQKADIDAFKREGQSDTLRTIEALEQSLSESQSTSERLEIELNKVKNDFSRAAKKLEELQAEDSVVVEGEETRIGQDTYNIISKRVNTVEEQQYLDEFELEALKNHKALKEEVVKLRESVTEQRRLIFTLESQVINLKKDLESSDLDESQKHIKQEEIYRLEKLLKETEGCVEVLESEVDYLQDKIKNISQKREESSENIQEEQKLTYSELQQKIQENKEEIQIYLERLDRGRLIREGITNSIEKISRETGFYALEKLAAAVLDIVKPLRISIHLVICSALGDIETENVKKSDKAKILTLKAAIKNKFLGLSDSGSGFTITFSRLGVYAEGSPTEVSSLGAVYETLSFILLIANTMIINVEERHASESRNTVLKKLIEGVKKNLNSIAIQHRYQSDEAKRIQDGFFKELNECLHTLNITENQSRFFNEMIEEAQERMKVLFASEVVVDSSFNKLIERLDGGAKQSKSAAP